MKEYQVHECFGARVRKLSRILDNKYRKLVLDFGISENQLNILFFLNKFGEVDQGTIGKKLILERSTTSRNLNVLDKQGLVTRSEDYRPMVKITAKGESLVQEILPKWNKLMNEMGECLGAEGIESLKLLEQRII